MPLSGVLISCDTMARKRDLARLAASAWSRASQSARSASTRAGRSRPPRCTSPPALLLGLGARRAGRALGLDPVGDVAADALHFAAGLAVGLGFARPARPHHRVAPRD